MANRSQRHKQEYGYRPPVEVEPPPPPITPTIVITALDPNSAPRNTSVSAAVIGSNLQPGDTIVWDGGAVATNYIWAGQVTCDTVVLGPTPKTVMVHLERGAEVSNELPFTVT
jgi:hypothetical protein